MDVALEVFEDAAHRHGRGTLPGQGLVQPDVADGEGAETDTGADGEDDKEGREPDPLEPSAGRVLRFHRAPPARDGHSVPPYLSPRVSPNMSERASVGSFACVPD